jgi:hypothetical protein
MSAAKTPGSVRRTRPVGDYEVGYCKPPVKNRFKKGETGNPRGAPKQVKRDDNNAVPVIADAAEILNEKIEITERGRKKKAPLREVIARRYIHTAAKSDDPKVLGDLMKFMEKVDRAIQEGRGGEPLKIIIEGGLPDDYADQFRPDGSDDQFPLTSQPPDDSADEISKVSPVNDQPGTSDQKK